MKVQFYILGLLLRYGAQHGYRLKQIVEEQISDFTDIKLPTIYYHLEKMKESGYITANIDKDGNRPEKTVYTITDEGKKYFDILLKNMQVEELGRQLPLDGAIFFHERISEDDFFSMIKNAIQITEQKLENVMIHRDAILKIIPKESKKDTKAIFSHHIHHLEAELEWLKEQEKEMGD